MTDEQYHALMEQMYDNALCLNNTTWSNRDTLERMRLRVAEASPITTLDEGRIGVQYCITNIDTSNDDIIRLMTLGFVAGSLVKVETRTGDALEVALMGTRCAIRNSEAQLISVVKFT